MLWFRSKNRYFSRQKMTTKEQPNCFEKLADSLRSWRVKMSGDKKDLWMHKWDINCLTCRDLDTAVTWLEWHKNHDYAKGFKAKFRALFEDVHKFYENLERGELDEEEIFREQVPILEDSAKQLAEHVLTVKYLSEEAILSANQIQKQDQTEGCRRSVEENARSPRRSTVRVIVYAISGLVGFLAALLGVLNHLGCLEPIKTFIYRILLPK